MHVQKIILLLILLVLEVCVGTAHAADAGILDHGSGWYPAGTNLTITATPDIYYLLDRWEGDTGDATFDASKIAFNVDRCKTLTAVFAPVLTDAGSVPQYWLADINPDWTNDFESAATNDWDGDGFTTAQEYWSGTDPTNDASYLHIAAASRVGAAIRLSWSHARVDSRIPPIRIERRTNLVDGLWEHVDDVPPLDGMTDWEAPLSTKAFYRLRVTN